MTGESAHGQSASSPRPRASHAHLSGRDRAAERRRQDPGRHHRRGGVAARACRQRASRARRSPSPRPAISACAPSASTRRSSSFRSTWSRTSRASCGSAASRRRRVIVQGQDFVREGQKVEAVMAAELTATQSERIASNADATDRTSFATRLLSQGVMSVHRLRHRPRAADDRDADLPAGRGLVAYVTIPKEAEPDIKIPIIYVQLSQRGISPEDPSGCCCARSRPSSSRSATSRRCARPPSRAAASCCSSSRRLRLQVRARRRARQGRPGQARSAARRRRAAGAGGQPLALSGAGGRPGDVPERTLLRIARAAKNAIEQAPGVLAAELRGARDEAVEIIIDPT